MQEIGLRSPAKLVRGLEFKVVRVIHEGPQKLQNRGYWQYRLLIVKELVQEHEPSKRLAEAILERIGTSHGKLMTASISEIHSGRAADGLEIGDSAGYLFGEQRVGSEPPPHLIRERVY